MSDPKQIGPGPASTDELGGIADMLRELERPSPAARRVVHELERDASRAGKLVLKAVASEEGTRDLAGLFLEALAGGSK